MADSRDVGILYGDILEEGFENMCWGASGEVRELHVMKGRRYVKKIVDINILCG